MSDDLSLSNPGFRGARAGRYGTGPQRISRGGDADMRRMLMFAGGVGGVLALLIGVSAITGHRSTEIPIITADARPIRVKPENPGGMKIDAAENDVFSGGSDRENAKLAPAAEAPDSKAWHAASAPPAPVPAQIVSPSLAVDAAPAPPPVALAAPPAGPVATVSASKQGSGAAVVGKDAKAANTAPLAARSDAAANMTAAPAASTVAVTAPAAKEASKSLLASAANSPVAPGTTTTRAPGHAAMVQLAALGSEQAARDEWLMLSKKMPELLNGRQPSYSHTERDGHMYWRVRTAGFGDVAGARAFCEHVRAKGAVCSVADF